MSMNLHLDSLYTLRLFLTAEQACNYLPGRPARQLVVDPLTVDKHLYSHLATLGFRRSGDHVYRPHCAHCKACLSLRIPVQAFQADRSQRRAWNNNRDLQVRCLEPGFHAEHYRLFMRYLKSRHPHGGMDDGSPESYLTFISAGWSDTWLYEFRQATRLLAVAVTDRLDAGLSAVYTFFDPAEAARSLGTYAILWQIAEARRLELEWVYLGYWVQECLKMVYKANFRPHQVFIGGQWITVT
jgi:arginyl-tRNA--protein-N-Asp/Glu arginylyltransferase